MSTNSREAMRAAFEAWACKHGYRMDLIRDSDVFDCDQTAAAWHAWTASRQQAMEEATAICTRKAEGIARVNTYRGKVNAASQHAIDMVEDCAEAIREAGKE